MTQNIVVGTIAAISTVVGTFVAVSVQFVSKQTFMEFKEGTVMRIDKRMDQMDTKLDKLLEEHQKIAREMYKKGESK